MTLDTKKALDDVYEALAKADLPGVDLVEHPQHLAVIGHAVGNDFAIWVSPYGRPVVYKIEGAGESLRCAGVEHVVEHMRRLTAPSP